MKSKPKKNQLRRLREFAQMFGGRDHGGERHLDGVSLEAERRLRDEADYALTGKRSPALEQNHQVAEDVARLNKLSRKGVGKFLAGGDA